jgi:hypothetical protein
MWLTFNLILLLSNETSITFNTEEMITNLIWDKNRVFI